MADSHPTEVTHQMGYFMQWVTSGSKGFSTLSALGTKVGYFMGYFRHAQGGLLRRGVMDATSWGSLLYCRTDVCIAVGCTMADGTWADLT